MANPVTLTRTISGTPDMRVLIENGQFARPLLFGTTWNEIRIGIRWHMRDSGANLASNPQVFLGVCSGDTNLWGDATTTHAVGINFNAATWTRNTTNYQVSGVNTIFPAKRVGSTITRGSTFYGMGDWKPSGSGRRRSNLFVLPDFERQSELFYSIFPPEYYVKHPAC
jgi:hypothetical protein